MAWGVLHAGHSFNGFRSTQILTDPKLLGTTTIPAHHEVGSWTLETQFFHAAEFLFHLLSDRYWDVAGSEERIWFSPFLQLDLVFVSKSSQSCEQGWIRLSYGMCVSISGVIHSHNEMSAMIEGNPRRLFLRWRITYTSSVDTFWPVESVTLHCPMTSRAWWVGPYRASFAGLRWTPSKILLRNNRNLSPHV